MTDTLSGAKPIPLPLPTPVALTLDAKTPLLLLPVNIETRFMAVNDKDSELWVRIYPDQIAINTHEPELTLQEISDGQSYWTQVWSLGNPPAVADGTQGPWRGLASIYGPQRAAWIVLQLTPTNTAQQPTAAAATGVPPSPLPSFPSPMQRASSWEQPATASALPDSWTVLLVSGSQTTSQQGGPITPDLAMGITPLNATNSPPAGTSPFPPGSPVDAGLQWLVDFDSALVAGMALKISLTPEQRDAGFDRIFVYGLRTSAVGGSTELGDLLDAHHYTDGFALVPQGTPTKNSADASSGYSRNDPNDDISYSVECEGPLTAQAGCDGDVFANLLGIGSAHLAHTQYADGTNARNGQDMLNALWPGTIGYFLSQMMDDVFQSSQIESAREYVSANTIPRGAVPAFRVGTTPYGVLPVTSLTRYKLARPEPKFAAVENGLVTFVSRLWPAWLASSESAPHMQTTGDPDASLIALLGMDASAINFRGRSVVGDDFLWNLLNFLGVSSNIMAEWLADAIEPGRQLLNSYDYNSWNPRVIAAALFDKSFSVGYPTVQPGALSETEPLTSDAEVSGSKINYIQWLVQASVDDIKAQNYPGTVPTSLLYMILRQSLILVYANLAATAEVASGRLDPTQFRQAELINIPLEPPPAKPPISTWELLSRPSVPSPALNWGEYLVGLDVPPSSPYAQLATVRNSLAALAALPTAELDRLLTETLDACSHRLDVWASTIANALLSRTRANNTGLHLGAFGWVEDVRPAPQRAKVAGAELVQVQKLDTLRAERVPGAPELPVPVTPLTDNGGYIYAPSAVQAAVAAVLRNGYMTHKGTPEEALLAMDLSSERVRYALYLLQGVQRGQSLNALLGYLFEAGLDTLGLQIYIQPFRDRFPVVGTKLTPSSAPTESIAASNVVDGLALRTAWDTGHLASGTDWGAGLPAAGSADQKNVIGLLETIDDYSDALGDLSLAETVFQIVRGNFPRSGALLDAISKGDRPPDPDVTVTQRGGTDLTHRVAVLLAGEPTVTPNWSGVPTNARAAAEPWLEAWLTTLLPAPSSVACSVQYTDSLGNAQSADVTLAGLNVGALDCLSMADAAEIAQLAELEARIQYAAAIPAGSTAAAILYQLTTPPAGWVSFPDFFFLAKALRNLVSGARALTPQDMTVPENNVTQSGLVDNNDLATRADNALTGLGNDIAALTTAQEAQTAAASAYALSSTPGNLAALTAADGPLRAALLACSYYGVIGSVPTTITDASLGAQATSVLSVLTDRQSAATAPNTDSLGVLTAIFGQGFVVLPHITPPDPISLTNAFAQSTSLVASDPTAPSRWLTQLTHIRPAISRLDFALSLALAIGAPNVQPFAPLLAQLPETPGDRWLGLTIDPNNPPTGGRVAFACYTLGDVTQSPYAGLLVDDWPERIPSSAENASVAFHYEEPQARAPQTCLLAVCPDDRATWDDDLVAGILEETLELAKIRAVDLVSLQGMGQILPALYFTFNLKAADISINFVKEKPVVK